MKLKESLDSTRLLIRNYEPTDLDFCTSIWLDEENGKFLSDPTAAFVDKTYQKALDTLQDSTMGYYLIAASPAGHPLIGTFSVFPDETNAIYDIGYCIHKEYWNQGYGTELVKTMIQWVRKQGGKKITAEVAVENTASNSLLQKLGFVIKQESVFEKYGMNTSFKSMIYELEL